jgi:3-hydroxyisobutyrate dehydrogenase-like beta-hydroxyacid dehydrogenase
MTDAAKIGRVALLGLGAMGSAMAQVLLRADVDLTVWNRSPEAAEALLKHGASLAASPLEAAAGVSAVITMLADDAALDAVMNGPQGALSGMDAGALHLGMSTIGADAADHWQSEHAKRQQLFVAAPVFGRPNAAAAGSLFTVAAGSDEAIARAGPLLSLLGQRNFVVGAHPSQACAVKLAGNFMIMAATEALGEAMAVANTADVDAAALLEVITGSIFNAPIYHAYGSMLVERRFSPAGFTAELGLKDLGLFEQLADSGRVPAPFLGILRERLQTVIERHGPDTDWAAVGAVSGEDASSA